MRNRLNQITRFLILIGAASLIGCATPALTTRQWGVSKGFERVDLKGKEYFCRLEPTNPPSNLSSVSCLTMGQFIAFRNDGIPIMSTSSGDGSAPGGEAFPEARYCLSF